MKQALLTLFCLLSLYSRGQDYIPLLNDNSWYLHFWAFMAPNDDMGWTQPVGNVTINDTVYTHYQESYSFSDNFPPTENNYYIREDIEQKKVYTRIDDEDRLLYDFSMEVGDQIDVNIDDFPYTFAVVAKDSFAVDTGRKRVMLILEDVNAWDGGIPEYWIEGVGSLNHPLRTFENYLPDLSFQVLCNHYGDEMPYSVDWFGGQSFTCPQPTSEPEPWPDDYIPLINDNYWYVNSMMFTNMDSFWVQPIEEVTINETAYMHYQETIMVIDTPVVNDYYIREDVEAKRVYKHEDGNEYLMYDFSLEEGDNITLDFAGDLLEYTVVSKDSFAVNIGRQRVRLILQGVGSEATETWIEGLGNLRHPLKNFLTIIQDPHYTLLCNNYDGEVAYSVNEFIGAPFTCPERGTEPEPPLGINDYLNPGVSVYPNPFRESFVILAEVPFDKAVLTLHDILGREIKRLDVSGSEIEVSRESLPAGIYMLRIEQDGEFILNGKVIAE